VRGVVGPPCFDDPARLDEVAKQVFVETLIPQASIECLDECGLHRFAGRDLVPADAGVPAPPRDGVRPRLGIVVDDIGFAGSPARLIQFTGHAPTAHGTVQDSGQGFAGTVIHNARNAEPRPSDRASDTKSNDRRRFALSGTGIGLPLPKTRLRPPRLPTVSPFFPVKAEQLLVGHLDALTLQAG